MIGGTAGCVDSTRIRAAGGALKLLRHQPRQLDQIDPSQLEPYVSVDHGIHPVRHQVGLLEDVGYDLTRRRPGVSVPSCLRLEKLGVGLDDRDGSSQLVHHEPDQALRVVNGLGVGEQGAEGERQAPPFDGLVLDLLHNQALHPTMRVAGLGVGTPAYFSVVRTSQEFALASLRSLLCGLSSPNISGASEAMRATINLRRGVQPRRWPP